MTKPAHTPVHRCSDAECCYFGQPTANSCACHKPETQMLREQRDDLYEVLSELCDRFDTIRGEAFINPDNSPWARARAALAKAEGRS